MNFALFLSAIAAGVSSFTLGPHKTKPLLATRLSARLDDPVPIYPAESRLGSSDLFLGSFLANNDYLHDEEFTPSYVNLFQETSNDEMCVETLLHLRVPKRFGDHYLYQKGKLQNASATKKFPPTLRVIF